METKTEQMPVSGDASVSSEKTGAVAEPTVNAVDPKIGQTATEGKPESADASATAEKKPQTRRSARTTGKRKTAAAAKAEGSESERTEAAVAAETAPADEAPQKKQAENTAASEPSVSPAEAPAEKPQAKKPARRKTAAKTSEPKSAEQKPDSAEVHVKAENAEKVEKKTEKAPEKKTEAKPAPKKTAAKKSDETKPEPKKPAAKPSSEKQSEKQPEQKPEEKKSEGKKPETKKSEPKKTAAKKTAPKKSETAKTEQSPKNEASKTEEPKTETPVAEALEAGLDELRKSMGQMFGAIGEAFTPSAPATDTPEKKDESTPEKKSEEPSAGFEITGGAGAFGKFLQEVQGAFGEAFEAFGGIATTVIPETPEEPSEKPSEATAPEEMPEEVPAAPEKPEEPEEIEKPEKKEPDAASAFVHPEPKTETVDVSGTPPETFVFFSPSQLAEMEEERRRTEAAQTAATVPADEPAPAEEPAEEVPAAEAPRDRKERKDRRAPQKVEEPKVEEPAEEPTEEPSENTVEEPAETPVAPSVPETPVETVPERKPENRKRGGDPHERDVMDKERVYANLASLLAAAGELERRTLIEDTMKTVPLTEEERRDNRPTSLSNRVRSVIGSLLAEMISAGKIVTVGRKLTLASASASPAPAVDREEDEQVVEPPRVAPEETAAVATVDLEIDFVSENDNPIPAVEPAPAKTENAVPEVPAVSEETSEVVPEETEAPETAPETVDADPVPVQPAPVREGTVRRVKPQRGERRPAQAAQPAPAAPAAILITEEELERVILNTVRRNSATKNDLFAALKHVFVEPNRLSKEEENRIYTVAGNVLQKLVNRGTLQNSDGRYLQKPSQRILNPGRAPGPYSTGNVEARFITELNRQSGDFFEQFAARLLEKYFEMSNVRVDASYVVGGSDDNGIDIMIETTDWLGYKERVFVQAKKRATQPVTLKEVREFYGALCAEEGTRGVFITTSSFCMEASKMIGKIRNLIAIDKRKLFALAEHCEVGLVRDEDGRLLLDENLFLDYDV